MSQSVKYVGLDVHKDTIVVAVAEDGKRSEVREHGVIANTPAALKKLLGKLGGPGVDLQICYEAGPCGYGIQRQVTAAGYAATIHESQGSEYPAVVIPVMTQHYAMLQRNLIYTGVTRGKKLVVLVGQSKAVAIAVKNESSRRRWTKLKEWL